MLEPDTGDSRGALLRDMATKTTNGVRNRAISITSACIAGVRNGVKLGKCVPSIASALPNSGPNGTGTERRIF